jgi:hypothetical protein
MVLLNIKELLLVLFLLCFVIAPKRNQMVQSHFKDLWVCKATGVNGRAFILLPAPKEESSLTLHTFKFDYFMYISVNVLT